MKRHNSLLGILLKWSETVKRSVYSWRTSDVLNSPLSWTVLLLSNTVPAQTLTKIISYTICCYEDYAGGKWLESDAWIAGWLEVGTEAELKTETGATGWLEVVDKIKLKAQICNFVHIQNKRGIISPCLPDEERNVHALYNFQKFRQKLKKNRFNL